LSWTKIATLVIALALIVAGGVYAYRFYQAPEAVDVVTPKWESSGHADTTSRSFTRWDNDDPSVIPVECANCHSTYGYHDYLGADGSAYGEVETPPKTGGVLFCTTCHNSVGHTLKSVIFPGETEVVAEGWEANCMRCHQGRESTASVNAALGDLEPDAVSAELGFISVHYRVAAATQQGSVTSVGYEYPGKIYAGRYPHTQDFNTCIECHDPHSTAIDPKACAPCHANVVEYGDLYSIRDGKADYDGDGDIQEGIYKELQVLHEALYAAIQAYAAETIGAPIVYSDSYPYWMNDTNGNGQADPDEVNRSNAYASWSPRLVRTIYTYTYIKADPGAFAHNPSYAVQLVYDALEDLNATTATALAGYTRP